MIKDKNIRIAIGIAIIIIGGALYLSFLGFDDKGLIFISSRQTHEEEIKRVIIDIHGDPFLGKEDAPVTLIEFADFQCPSCVSFHFGAGEVIIDEYVKKGLVKMVYKDFPLLGEESFFASYAANCAQEHGKFWEYHDYLFTKQLSNAIENNGVFSLLNLINAADILKLSKDSFADCIRSEKHKDKVLKDIADGKQAGVSGTPTVFINGRIFEGLLTFEEYKKIIEEELVL